VCNNFCCPENKGPREGVGISGSCLYVFILERCGLNLHLQLQQQSMLTQWSSAHAVTSTPESSVFIASLPMALKLTASNIYLWLKVSSLLLPLFQCFLETAQNGLFVLQFFLPSWAGTLQKEIEWGHLHQKGFWRFWSSCVPQLCVKNKKRSKSEEWEQEVKVLQMKGERDATLHKKREHFIMRF